MNQEQKLKFLRVALVVIGVTFIAGIWLLGQIWPSGWQWHTTDRSYYYEMILVVYATLGVFLVLAARDPVANRSLIWFTVWSSITHASVMLVQSFDGESFMGHLWGDVLALYLVAALLAYLMPGKSSPEKR
jgi:hypothetical protein